MLKTAGGYLIVLQTFDEEGNGSEQCVRLMQKAKEEGDWDLCKELARFLMALDETGNELRKALEKMEITLKHSSPSRSPISSRSDAEDQDHVDEENFRSKTAESYLNGAPREYAVNRLDSDEDVSPRSSLRRGFGQENRSRLGENEDEPEDYFSQKGRS